MLNNADDIVTKKIFSNPAFHHKSSNVLRSRSCTDRPSGLVTHMNNYGDLNVYTLINVENLISSVE